MFSIPAGKKFPSSFLPSRRGALATLGRLPAAFGWLGVRPVPGRAISHQTPRHWNSPSRSSIEPTVNLTFSFIASGPRSL